ncbi:hypothetical protein HNP84_007939 [Thermocatellispora tengchongensis]|uniref:M23ase beta-sheet core domain-containing protein n=1 Tax=Thermocatellispora tengchongensis TaxID=1073253 RepID=A0A840PH72_9ACTN|nr:M23 family metallopeptidase [Thermocatellispora tengchongensis]MBB5138186.1 hypothetical protein [Thermocatellispora tengchongensis]
MHILVALALAATGGLAPAHDVASASPVGVATSAYVAAPTFKLPFTCGQAWHGTTSSSAHRTRYEIDFNWGGSPDADLGQPVLAAAAGTVIMSEHRGSKDGFGNVIKIKHGDLVTVYAHLNSRKVAVGATVAQGQQIGTVGKTTKPSRTGMPAHLHYEVRTATGSYPGNIRAATFEGRTFRYPSQTLTSTNCGGRSAPVTAPANPYTPEQVCGSGYKKVDSAALGGAGTVYLLYNSAAGKNCVVTMKRTGIGSKTATSAYLEVKGKPRTTDSGSYAYYAGPVRAAARGVCVKWGGSAGSARYDSPFEHCG